jgi:hypothetical protein
MGESFVPCESPSRINAMLSRPLLIFLVAGSLLVLVQLAHAESSSKTEAFFNTKIRPVMTRACLPCHSATKVRGGLRLDTRARLLEGGDRGPAIVPGSPEKSLLIRALRHQDEDLKMPPGKPLTAGVVQDFITWIKAGAAWPDGQPLAAQRHWSFEPIRAPAPPVLAGCENAIDAFVRARLDQHRITPAPEALKLTLLRRVTFDLTGLPPTPDEIDAFLADTSANAYAQLVDRLLASPRYGERWARHWLDVVRYSDSGGFEADHFYPNAWQFRDYVIRSFNSDKPLHRFIQEQIAGDELWPGDAEAAAATALYCVGPVLEESAMIGNQLEQEWLNDAADTTGAAFLGLTMGCARCHDHKFDPISQKDYYGLQAVFAASDRPYPVKIRLARIKVLNGLLSDTVVRKEFLNDPRCTLRTEQRTGFRLFHRDEPFVVRRLHRGEIDKARETLGPAVPEALRNGTPTRDFQRVTSDQRRATLARWLTAPENPLTARVLVNRVWGWHFGRPIVATPNDFGIQGELPSHPDLLDWLARDFIEHGWQLKRLHRQIVLSRTYRMQSVVSGPVPVVDPKNRLLWHFPRRRLEGEVIRDALLACAGTLNGKSFGPPVTPPLDAEELTGLFNAAGKWPVTKNAAEHTRRTIYLLTRRTFTHPLLAAFDAPEQMSSCPGRRQTIVPTQALTLFNSPLARAQAAAFARRVLRECDSSDSAGLVRRAWLLAFGRPVSPFESRQAMAFLEKRDKANVAREVALAELCLALFNTNEFIYVD